MSTATEFFQTSGALSEEAPSYIERRADAELLAALERRELCLVLAPRQMGKSSLMVHALVGLRAKGVQAGIVDLQPLGSEQDPNRWFSDVLYQIERSLRLETDSADWWESHGSLGPTQRFMTFLEDVVLREVGGDVVLFVDEVDSVLPLLFSDDFFTSIRALYNARAHNPALRRLTFVLLGVTTATSLIQDRSRTPFNIGTAIPLHDFDKASVEPFRRVLGSNSDPLIERIFYWTSGQPLLVQRLAAAAYAWPPESRTPERIDEEIHNSYLDLQITKDTHLKFIQDYLLDRSANVRETLGIYGKVLEGKEVSENQQSPAQVRLRLAGVVRAKNGQLIPRNRVYQEVFNLPWVRENIVSEEISTPLNKWLDSGRQEDYLLTGRALEEALDWAEGRTDVTPEEHDFLLAGLEAARRKEQDRLRAQRNMVLALWAMIGIMLVLLFVTVRAGQRQKSSAQEASDAAKQARKAEKQADAAARVERQAEQQAKRAEQQAKASAQKASQAAETARKAEQQAKASALRAQEAAHREQVARLKEQAAKQQAVKEAEKARKAEQQATHQRTVALSGSLAANSLLHPGTLLGLLLAAKAAEIWPDEAAKSALQQALSYGRALAGHTGTVFSAAFSPDGKMVVTASNDNTARLWRASTGTLLHTLVGHTGAVNSAAFSPDGRMVVTASTDGTARLWQASTGKLLHTLASHTGMVFSAAFSPDGKMVVTTNRDTTASPGRTVGLSRDEAVRLWQASTGTLLHTLTDHMGLVFSAAFSPDGRMVVTASTDGTVRLWRASTGTLLHTLAGHTDAVFSAAFSPDGKMVVTASYDHTARLYFLPIFDRPVPEQIAYARKLAGRDLTPAEKAQYLTLR